MIENQLNASTSFKSLLEKETEAYLNDRNVIKTLSSSGLYIIENIFWLKINVNKIEQSEIAVRFLHQPNTNFVVHYFLEDFLKPMLEDSSKINYSVL